MRVRKKDTPRNQTVEIWCLGLWMPAQRPNPVVQIVDCQEQHIRMSDRWGFLGWAGRCKSAARERPDRHTKQARTSCQESQNIHIRLTAFSFHLVHGECNSPGMQRAAISSSS
jgi:hypothetical protein